MRGVLRAHFGWGTSDEVDLENDLGERHDLATKEPAVLAAIVANFSAWWDSIQDSIEHESKCPTNPTVRRVH